VPIYRCYLIDSNDRCRVAQQLEGVDGAAALLEGARVLDGSEFVTLEIWRRGRLIVRWSRSERTSIGAPKNP
jgi:hypothetical protein